MTVAGRDRTGVFRMFFLLRSAFCITAVVMSLPDRARPSSAEIGHQAVAAVRAFCRSDPRSCLSFIGDAGAASAAQPAPARVPLLKAKLSTDTLLPADFRPAWSGPASGQRS